MPGNQRCAGLISILLFVVATLCLGNQALADGLTISDGIQVILANSSEMDMHCGDVLVQSGGSLDIGDSTIFNCRNFTLDSGALFNDNTGLLLLNGGWTNNSDFIKNLAADTIQFVVVCGGANSAAGSGDTDDDGLTDGEEGVADANGDGWPDFLMPLDSDGDGVTDRDDGCPFDALKLAPGTCGCGEPDTATCNLAPDQPSIIGPDDGETGVSMTPQLLASDFSDTDAEDTHTLTEWQISTDGGFSSLGFNAVSAKHLRQLTVPEGVLAGETRYYTRVRFFDDSGVASDWSDAVFFVTQASSFEDENQNGVPDDQEVNPDLDIDGNGVADVDQDGIKCVRTDDGREICVCAAANVASVDTLRYVNPNTIDDDQGRPGWLVAGLINFSVTLLAPENRTGMVRVYVSGEMPPLSVGWYKHDTVDGWRDYSDYLASVVNLSVWDDEDRTTVFELGLEDGGPGDVDGLANGTVVDPSGPVVSQDHSFSWSHGGSCFIESLFY